MLFVIGKRATGDLADQLLACHDRIRRFVALAARLATEAAAPEELGAAALIIARYFSESFPLHLADEEALARVLAARDEILDAALGDMMMDHVAHAADVAELVAICREIADDPETRPRLSRALAAVVQRLEGAFSQHLALEERVIFPAIRHLPPHYQLALRVAAQRRRAA
ncbi:MAG TPA: hemerythrin domain-containing protein [Kofleriaceae bacterium]